MRGFRKFHREEKVQVRSFDRFILQKGEGPKKTKGQGKQNGPLSTL